MYAYLCFTIKRVRFFPTALLQELALAPWGRQRLQTLQGSVQRAAGRAAELGPSPPVCGGRGGGWHLGDFGGSWRCCRSPRTNQGCLAAPGRAVPTKGTGAVGPCAHSECVQVGSPRGRRWAGPVRGASDAEPESRPYPKDRGHTKSLKEGEWLGRLSTFSSPLRLLCGGGGEIRSENYRIGRS